MWERGSINIFEIKTLSTEEVDIHVKLTNKLKKLQQEATEIQKQIRTEKL